LRIREGDPLEIFTDDDGHVILKKYSAMGVISDFALQYAESIAKASGHIALVTDRDSVIAVAGASKKEFFEKKISHQLEKVMDDRASVLVKSKGEGFVPVLEDDKLNKYSSQAITPIITHGDPIGAVILLSMDTKTVMGEVESKLAQTAALVLGKQLEQ